MPNNLIFSIIIPTYNRSHLITRTIQSVLKQNYSNYEIIIVDDGSTDNTDETVNRIKDHRIRYYKKRNGERGAARNYGTKAALGKYLTFLDSDDILYQDMLSNTSLLAAKNDYPEIIASAYEIKKSNGEVVRTIKYNDHINQLILKGNILSCIGVFLRRDIALLFPFNEDRKFSGSEDWLLWLRLASRYTFIYSNKITASLIQHNDRSVLAFNEENLLYRTEMLIKYLREDHIFMKRFGTHLNLITAHMLSYSALHLALCKKSVRSIKYLLKAVLTNFKEIFSTRFLAIIIIITKNILRLR